MSGAPEQFGKLEVVVVGAEKMPLPLLDEFENKFGVRPVEGYGATELSPVVSVNIPPSRSSEADHLGRKDGTVGRPLPTVEARVVSLDEDEPLGVDEPGLLEIRGPNVMAGYLNQPEMTTKVMHDRWYRTGDMAKIDENGFIEITGRLSRFSKIGGEMVPHIQIEEALTEIVGEEEDGALRVAVTSAPDAKRGERIVVLHTPLDLDKSVVLQKLSAAGLPNIYLPNEDSFVAVEEIPVLGSGKLDLKGMKDIAAEKFPAKTPS